MSPARSLTVHEYDGGWANLPHLTDDASFTGRSRDFGRRLLTLRMTSLVAAEDRENIPAESRSQELVKGDARHIRISRDDVLTYDPPRDPSPRGLRRVLRSIRNRSPLLYDELRDLELLRHRRSLTTRAAPRDYDGEFVPGGAHDDSRVVIAPAAPEGAERAVIIGLHWFELGGAERWAFETVKLVREAGLLPIVLTNRESHQPWIGRPELDGALIIPFSEPTVASQTPGVEELLRGILGAFDIRGVVVHHNQWLYDRLPWIAASRPGIPIVDSTHIVEYRGGGYPRSSVVAAPSITAHHVISPTLARWMTETQGIPAAKVFMAPLGGLTVELKDAKFRERNPDAPFTVAFVGRFARQKAPEVFIAMAGRVRAAGRTVRFIMHGDGELAGWADEFIALKGLGDVIERRSSAVPVDETLAEADLLVVTSHNEGLTLTTLEAIAHGVPVVSTDVGAQADIVPRQGLISRRVHRSVSEAARRVLALESDEAARRELWTRERKSEKKLLSQQSATEWFAQEVGTW
ncbi:glycosyltransferase [Microbacterium sp. NPDC056569]|uniref:glycosyltransferase n=1 Tax=Microbacterium sp. NPDC056569 TaxID=3345867 RepID=UPI00366E5F99